jgi:hypothetical protein
MPLLLMRDGNNSFPATSGGTRYRALGLTRLIVPPFTLVIQ